MDAGIDRTYVSRLEHGLENPTVAVLERIALALEAEITEPFAVLKKNDGPPPPLTATKEAPMPHFAASGSEPSRRAKSPVPGCSMLITSAPIRAS